MEMMAHDNLLGADVLSSSVHKLEKVSKAVLEVLCATWVFTGTNPWISISLSFLFPPPSRCLLPALHLVYT
jgi:hypothetical protein